MARYDKLQRRRQRSIRKRFSRNRRVNRFASAAGMGALAAMAMPWANSVVYADSPQGANPVHGNVAIYKDGQLMQIHASNNAVIDYESFNIGAGYTVEFIQPGQMSRVLNRVISGDPTRIDGNLTANGQVYIASPGGIFFGNNAVIDVAGLVAGAGNISDSDFLQGNDRFTNMSGSVINDGTIQGKAIALLGDYVANRGTIIAPEGMVTMSAGDEVFLGSRNGNIMVRLEGGDAERETAAVENEGTIDAGQTGRVSLGAGDVYNLAVRNTGSIRGNQVIVSGEGSRVEVAGNIDASNANGQGGEVQVLGEQVVVHDGATIDASGSTGGGNIYIGGDYQGGGELYTADTTFVSADSIIRADATENGDGGEVIVWADGATGFFGNISGRGGENGGDGGFVEVSGKEHLTYRGLTDLRAPAGQAGTLLLDPTDITIDDFAGTSGDGSFDGNQDWQPDGNPASQIDIAHLRSQLELGSVTINTSAGADAGQAGYIDWKSGAPLDIDGLGTVTLSLVADSYINFFGGVFDSNPGGETFTLDLTSNLNLWMYASATGLDTFNAVSTAGAFQFGSVDTIEANTVSVTAAGAIDLSGTVNAADTASFITADTLTVVSGSSLSAGSAMTLGGENVAINQAINTGGDLNITEGSASTLALSLSSSGVLSAGVGNTITIGSADATSVTLASNINAGEALAFHSGGDITTAAVTGSANGVLVHAGQLDGGSAVSIGSLNVADGTVTFTGGAGTDNFTMTGTTLADTLDLQASISDATLTGAATLDTLTTAAGAYSIDLAGGGTVATQTTFNNTLSVSFGGTEMAFDAGVNTENAALTTLGTDLLSVQTGAIELGAISLAQDALIEANGQNLVAGQMIGNTYSFRASSSGTGTAEVDSVTNTGTLRFTGFDTVAGTGTVNVDSLIIDGLGTSATFDASVSATTVDLLDSSVAADYTVTFNDAVAFGTLSSASIDAALEMLGSGTVTGTTNLEHNNGLTLAGSFTFANGLAYTAGDTAAGGSITTAAAGNVSLGNLTATDTLSIDTNTNAFTSGTINGSEAVTITTDGGNATFGAVGGTTRLDAFNVIADAGTIRLNAGSIATAGAVTFGSTFELTENTTISTEGGAVDFTSTTVSADGGNHTLTLATADSSGTVAGDVQLSNFDNSSGSFVGNVLVDMQDDTAGTLQLTGGDIAIDGNFTVDGNAVQVAGNTNLLTNGGNADFGSVGTQITGVGAGRELTITTSGGEATLATVGDSGGDYLGLLSVDTTDVGGDGAINLPASVRVAGTAGIDAIFLDGRVPLATATQAIEAVGDITLGASTSLYATAANQSLTIDSTGGTVSFNGVAGDDAGNQTLVHDLLLAGGTAVSVDTAADAAVANDLHLTGGTVAIDGTLAAGRDIKTAGSTLALTGGDLNADRHVHFDHSGAVAIDGASSVTAVEQIILESADGATVPGLLTAEDLLIVGGGATFSLTNTDVNTLAADVATDLVLNQSGTLTIDSVTAALGTAGTVDGLSTGGAPTLFAGGDVNVLEAITATDSVNIYTGAGAADTLLVDENGSITGFSIHLSAGEGLFESAGAANTLEATSGLIYIGADNMAIGGNLIGTNALILQPDTDGRAIDIGDFTDDASKLVLSQAEIDRFAEGFFSITIGSNTGEHAIRVREASFNDSITIRTPNGGSINVLEGGTHGISLRDAASANGEWITLEAHGTADPLNEVIRLENDLLTTNGNITLSLAGGAEGLVGVGPEGQTVTLSTALLNTDTGGDITIDPSIAGAGSTVTLDQLETLSLHAGQSAITLNGELNPTGAPLAATLEMEASTITLPAGNYYGNPVFTADTINFPAGSNSIVPVASGPAAGTPDLNITLQPLTANRDIGIGNASIAGLQITQANLDAFAQGFSSITIGRSNGSGIMTINEDGSGSSVAFKDPMLLRMPQGDIIIEDATSGVLNIATIKTFADAVDGDHIRNATGNVNAVIVDPLTAGLTFHAGSATTDLAGRTETNGTGIEFINSVVLTGDAELVTTGVSSPSDERGDYAGADITFGGTLRGTDAGEQDLKLIAGDGNILFNGVVGSVALGDVVVTNIDDSTAAAVDVGTSASDVSAIQSFTARSFTQLAGGGNTSFNDNLTTRGQAEAGLPLGDGGDVAITTTGEIRLLGTTDTRGGQASAGDPGHTGGDISLSTPGRVVLGDIITDGSAASTGAGGDAGGIDVMAGARVTLNGDLTARGGTGDTTGAGGLIDIATLSAVEALRVEDNILIRTGTTGGNLVLSADNIEGDGNNLTIRTGQGDVTFDGATNDFGLIDVQTGQNVTFTDAVSNISSTEIAIDVDLLYQSTVAGGDITVDARDVDFDSGFTLTGALLISDARDVTVATNATAGNVQQVAGTGHTHFQGTLGTTNTNGLDLSTAAISFDDAVNVDSGPVTLVNTGQLTVASGADFTITGGNGFTQSGGGAVDLGANITTDGGSGAGIGFGSTINLTENVTLSTDANDVGNISLGGGVTAAVYGPGGQTLTLTAGSGNITVSDDIGDTPANAINKLTINSAADADLLGTVSLVNFEQTLGTGTTTFGDDVADDVHIVEDLLFTNVLDVVANASVVVAQNDATFVSVRDVTFNESLSTNGMVLFQSGRNLVFDDVTVSAGRDAMTGVGVAFDVTTSSTGSVTVNGALHSADSGNTAGGGDIVISTADVEFGPVANTITADLETGTDHVAVLTIEPTSVGGDLSVGTSGGLSLSNQDVAAISGDFRHIFIGRADGTGTMTIANGSTFQAPTFFRMPDTGGQINIGSGGVNGVDRASLTFDTTQLGLGGTVATAGLPVYFIAGGSLDTNLPTNEIGGDLLDVTVTGSATVDTTSNGETNGANIFFENNIEDNGGGHSLTLNSGDLGDIVAFGTLGADQRLGALNITNTENAVFADAVRAASFTQLDGQGVTAFNGTLDTTGAVLIEDANEMVFDFAVRAGSFTQNAGLNTTFDGTLTSLDTSGTGNQAGGDVEIAIAGDLIVNGDILAQGGDRSTNGDGFAGGSVELLADSIVVAGINTSGGTVTSGRGGDAGDITADAITGTLVLRGDLTALGSAGIGGQADGDAKDITLSQLNNADIVLNPDANHTAAVDTITIQGNDVTFDGTIDGTAALTVNTFDDNSQGSAAGVTTFNANVGETDALVALVTDTGTANGRTVINTAFVNATDLITFNDAVVLEASTTLRGDSVGGHTDAVEFNGTVDSAATEANNLIIHAVRTEFNAIVGGETGGALGTLLTSRDSGADLTVLNTSAINAEGIYLDDAVEIAAGTTGTTTLTATLPSLVGIRFSETIDSTAGEQNSLVAVAPGHIEFLGDIGTLGADPSDAAISTALGRLQTTATDQTFIRAATINTLGASVEHNGPVLIDDNLTYNEYGSGDVVFNGTVDSSANQAFDLTVNTFGGGTTRFVGEVGKATANSHLGTLATDTTAADGVTEFHADVTAEVITINDDLLIGDAGGVLQIGEYALTTDLYFGGTVDSIAGENNEVAFVATNSVTFEEAVGSNDRLHNILVDGGNTTTINGGSIDTTGSQLYRDAIVLGADTTMDSTNSSVTFNNTVDSDATARNLIVTAGTSAQFNGTLGGNAALENLTATADDGIVLVTESLTVNDTITLTAQGAPGGSSNSGVRVYNNAIVTAATIDITGTGGTSGSANKGIVIQGGTLTADTVNLTGTSGGNAPGGIGVYISSSLVRTNSGDLSIYGEATTFAGTTADHGRGIQLDGAPTVRSLGGGRIILEGRGGLGGSGSEGIHADNISTIQTSGTVEMYAVGYGGVAAAAEFGVGSAINAGSLALLDADVAEPGGNWALNANGDHMVGTLAADVTGSVAFGNDANLTVGTVTLADTTDVVGITITGASNSVSLEGTGNNQNLLIEAPITTNGGYADMLFAADITSTADGDITTTAGTDSGDDSGNVTLTSDANDIFLDGEIDTRGAANSTAAASNGGDVDIVGASGDVTLVAINSSGGAGLNGNDGGNAGWISVESATTGSITLRDDLTALGGSGDTDGTANQITLTNDALTGSVFLNALANDTITLNGGPVVVSSQIDSLNAGTPQHLVVNTTGDSDTVFSGAIGSTNPLASLTTNADGETYIDGGAVATTGDQLYNDDVIIDADTTFTTTTDNGDVRFFATLNSHTPGDDHDATFDLDEGTLYFGDEVGTTARLGDVVVQDALNVISLEDFVARSLTQQAGTGSTTFLGHIDTTGVGEQGGDIDLTTNGWIALVGGATLNGDQGLNVDAGSLTLAPDADGGGNLTNHPTVGWIPGTDGFDNAEAITGFDDAYLDIIVLTGEFNLLGGGTGIGGDVMLNPTGRVETAAVATIASLPVAGSDVTFNTGSFDVGVNEKMTVFGDFEVNATHGSITVGDMSILNNIRFEVATGQDIQFRRRDESTVITPGLLTQDDFGVDIVLGGEFFVNESPVALGAPDPAQPIIASPGGEHDPDGDGGTLTQAGFISRDFGGPLSAALLTLPGGAVSTSYNGLTLVLDLTPERATTANVSEAIAGAIPRPEQSGDVIRDTGVGQAQQEMLADLGILSRDLTSVEFLWLLAGQRVYNDLGGDVAADTSRVANNRLGFNIVEQAIAAYRNLMFEENMDPDTGEWTLTSRRTQLRRTLTSAFEAFQATGEPFSGEAFLAFARQNPDHMDAVGILIGLNDLIDRIELIGLTPRENATVIARLYSYLLPEGMTTPQLNAARQAVDADPEL